MNVSETYDNKTHTCLYQSTIKDSNASCLNTAISMGDKARKIERWGDHASQEVIHFATLPFCLFHPRLEGCH